MSKPDTKLRSDIVKSDETRPLLKPPKVRLMSGKEREDIMDKQEAIINQFKTMAHDIETIFDTDHENTQTIFELVESLDEYIKRQAIILEAEKKEKAANKIENQKRDRVGYAIGTLSTTTAVAATAALHLPVDAVLNSGSGAMTIGIGLGRAHQEIIELCKYIGSCLPSSCVSNCSSNEKSKSETDANNPSKNIDKQSNAEPLNSDKSVSPSATGIDVKVKNDLAEHPQAKKTKLKPLERIPKSQEVYIGNTVDLIQKQFENNQEMIALIEGKKEQLKTITDYISQQMDIMAKQKSGLEAEAIARKLEATDKAERERIGYLCGAGLSIAAVIGTAAASVPIAGVISSAGGAMTLGIGLGRGFHRAITKCCTCIGKQACCCATHVEITPPASPQMDRQDINGAAIPKIIRAPIATSKTAHVQSFPTTVVIPPNTVIFSNQQTSKLTSPSITARPITPTRPITPILTASQIMISVPSINLTPVNVSPSATSTATNLLSPTSSSASGSPATSLAPVKPITSANSLAVASPAPQTVPLPRTTTLPIIKRHPTQTGENNSRLSLATNAATTNKYAVSASDGSASTRPGTRVRSATGSAATTTAAAALNMGTPKAGSSSRLRSATPKGKTNQKSNTARR